MTLEVGLLLRCPYRARPTGNVRDPSRAHCGVAATVIFCDCCVTDWRLVSTAAGSSARARVTAGTLPKLAQHLPPASLLCRVAGRAVTTGGGRVTVTNIPRNI